MAQLVPLDPSDTCELALVRARLIAGGAMISPSGGDHTYAVMHIVVVGFLSETPSAEDLQRETCVVCVHVDCNTYTMDI